MAYIDVLIGVDGTHTSPIDDMPPEQYDADFATSHVRRIVAQSRFKERSHYIRGPAGLGGFVNDRFEQALLHIATHAAEDASATVRLHLAGFSRGAAIALDLANALSLPPQSRMAHLARVLTFGKTVRLVNQIDALRRSLNGRLMVASLALFDPVDMSTDIDEAPIGKWIGTAAIIRRSTGWGSRLGWTNIGDYMESGSSFKRARLTLDGTHGAMGGMPVQGDLPKALARALLKALPLNADWEKVEAKYRQRPLEYFLVKAVLGAPGLFVNPRNGGLLGAAAHASLHFMPEIRERISRAAVVHSYRRLLQSYAEEGGSMKGSVSLALNSALGSFPGIDAYFVDFKHCTNLITAFRELDRQASHEAMTWMAKAMGRDYPANAPSGG